MRIGVSGAHGLEAWGDAPVIELSGPLDGRLEAVLAAAAGRGVKGAGGSG